MRLIESTRRPARSRLAAWLGLLGLAIWLGGLPGAVAAADGLTMQATVLLGGHTRTGSWAAIEVHIRNDGPAVTGEPRLTGGTQSKTQFGTSVDLPTGSDGTHYLYAQPPAFGREITITLVQDGQDVASTKAAFTNHDPTQLMVGIVAERPGDVVGTLHLLPNANNVAPLTFGLAPRDLPARVEAWGALDRLIWQDTDASALTTEQLTALQGWIAGGGRLVIVGGTSGPATLTSFSDDLLPYRPTATTDVAASTLGGLVSPIPAGTSDLPALTGEISPGARTLATSGDRVVAAERSYGSGAVTLLGFDPTVSWIGESKLGDDLWRRLVPQRTGGGLLITDDSQIVQAIGQLPSLALPPVGGLLALLGAYILLIGPLNYFVLKRLDRREWAWLTMPVLIVAFAAGAYAFGSLLRGSDVIVNEVAIVRGAPGATEGTAQAYLGVFSPSRGTYQLKVPGGALLSAPLNGDFFGGDGSAGALDILQGDPSRVRDLAVGFGSLRAVRAETAVPVPLVKADVRLAGGRLQGSVTNASQERLLDVSVVLGGTVARVGTLEPGASTSIDTAIQPFQFGQSLSDRVVGQVFFGDPTKGAEDASQQFARHSIIDQLTYDPNFGVSGQLAADGPVILAWADHDLIPLEIEGQQAKRLGNSLYYLPTSLGVTGTTTFRNDLLKSTVISSDSVNFSKDPQSIYFGQGTVELAYRPVGFDGRFTASDLVLGLNSGDQGLDVAPTPVEVLPAIPAPCPKPPTGTCAIGNDGLPEVELYDVSAGGWKRLPHLNAGVRYAIKDPARYVDPDTASVRVRFVNDQTTDVGMSVDLAITGEAR